MGFFGFWALGITSSALTVFLERSPWSATAVRSTRRPPARMPEAERATGWGGADPAAVTPRGPTAVQPCWPMSP